MAKNNLKIAKPKLLLEIVICTYFYVIWFYLAFHCNLNTIIYSLIHSTLSIVLLYNIIVKFQKSYYSSTYSVVSITLLITGLYFYISSIKYTYLQPYPKFISNNSTRLFGSIIVFISIFFTTLLWFNYNKKRKIPNIEITKIKINTYLIYISVVLFLIYNVIHYIYNPVSSYLTGASEKSTKDQIIELFYSLFIYFIILMLGYYFEKSKAYTYVPLILFVFTLLFSSLTSGSRSTILWPLLGLLYIFLYCNKIKLKNVIHLILISPLLLMILTNIIFIISGRSLISHLSSDIAYRFDLSDFPFSVMKFSSFFRFDFSEILDGIKMSIPSVLYPSKGIINSQVNLFSFIGFDPSMDYTDSFFSMGAEVAGVIGMLCLYPIIIITFEYIDKQLSGKRGFGLLLKLLFFDVLTRIEIPWVNFIPSIRNKIICIFIGFIIYKLFINYKKSISSPKFSVVNFKE